MDSISDILRQLTRENLHRIWRLAQEGGLDRLTEEEQRFGKIMLDHSDEYFNDFEFADIQVDHNFSPGEETNPFLHVTLHAIIEKQLEDRDPIEAYQFYNAMLKNKCTRHEAIHLLSAIFIYFLFPGLKKGERFRLDNYCETLKIYKFRKPDKIMESLHNEPDFFVEENSESAQIFDGVRSVLETQNFESVEEAQAFMDDWLLKKNKESISDFLGLSPDQMHRLLCRPFVDTADIVTLNQGISKDEISDVPVVKEAVYFLRRLGELQPLRATAKGNLPRDFAQELHNKFSESCRSDYPIRSEGEDWKLLALRHILNIAGCIRKRNQKFSLAHNGEKIVEVGFDRNDFYHLLEMYARRFNWAFRDRYPPLEIIQQAFLFSCFLLHQKAKNLVQTNELSTDFIRAFPAVFQTIERGPSMESEKLIKRAFCVRFIERFCEYFGLVTTVRGEEPSFSCDYLIQTTPLFEKIFNWKLVPTE